MSSNVPSIRVRAWHAIAAPVAASAYLVVPTSGWGWLDGAPLGWLEAGAVMLVWWTWGVARSLPGARLLAALAVVKLALAGAFLDRGFAARYYANETWTPPAERSIEFPRAPFTRRDERLAFGTSDAPDLPLHFFNNVRWNYYRPDEPLRDRLAYSAEWTGFLRVGAEAATATLYIDGGPGISHELSVDGRPVMPLDVASPRLRSIELDPGWHALTIRASAPYGASRRIEAGEIVQGSRRPFDADRVFQRPTGAVRRALDTALHWTTRAIDTALLVWLGALVLRRGHRALSERRIVPLLWLAAIVEAVWHASRYLNRVTVLGGGDDMLMYEHFARVIALGDPLMQAQGPGGGQGAPFYFQPLYPYFLALTHFGFGDALFGAVLVQRLLLAATVGWAAAMTTRLFGVRAGWIALIGGGSFVYAKGSRWTDVLLSEPLFMPLLVGWIALLVRTAVEHASRFRAASAGVVGGLATLTRPTLLAGWPPILLVWWASVRLDRGRHLAALLLVLLAVINLATIRNWIVADRLVFAPTSFGASLQLGNPPARPLDPAPPERVRLYEQLGLDANVRAVAEFAVQAPGDFAMGLLDKALYVVGLFGWSGLPGGIGTSWLYVGMWLLTVAGAVRIGRAGAPRTAAAWLPAAGALSHAVPLVIVFPHGYTDRLILPLYPLLIPYAAYALEPVLALPTRLRPRLSGVLGAAVGGVRRGVVAALAPVIRERRNWLFLGYAVATASVDPVAALLLPVTALAVARVTRREREHRIVGAVLWAAALVHLAAAGSRSADALHDPLFWGAMATIALGLSAAVGRWRPAAAATAALAGGSTMVAVLLPAFPGFEGTFPHIDAETIRASIATMSRQFGVWGALSLLGVWTQGIVGGHPRELHARRVAAAARGALLTALLLTLAGAVASGRLNGRLHLMLLATLLGLVEAMARSTARRPARSSTGPTPTDTADDVRTR